MIFIEKNHLDLVKRILKQYDYSFFVFGSRVTGKSKRLSDIDLLYFEEIPDRVLWSLEEAFEESDLPYKVDLVSYEKSEESFLNSISDNYLCLQKSSHLELTERNFLNYFDLFSEKPEVDVFEMNGVTIINFQDSLQNISLVYGLNDHVHKTITTIKEIFNGKSFTWWIPPSQHHPEFSKELLNEGFCEQKTKPAMICSAIKTDFFQKKTDLVIKSVVEDFKTVADPNKESLLCSDKKVIHKNADLLCQYFFSGYSKDKLTITATLLISVRGAGMICLLCENEPENLLYGSDMMISLLKKAQEQSCTVLTLSVLSHYDHYFYEHFGFRKIGYVQSFDYRGTQ